MARPPGRLVSIATRERSGAAMQERSQARIDTESGVEGDSRGKPGPRQVTVVSKEAWEAACADVQAEVVWTERRANLLIEGLDLRPIAGARLRVGSALLEITGDTDPCTRMDAVTPGLHLALARDARGGVHCRVLESGSVSAGDPAAWEEA